MRIFLGLGAVSLLAVGCLLVNPVGRLEGSPLQVEGAGGGGTGGSAGGPVDDAGLDDVDAGEADAQGPTHPSPILFRDRMNGGIPRGIALSDNGVYWAEVSPLGILYAPKVPSDAGPMVVHLDTNSDFLNDVFDVAVDETNLYWTEYMQNEVYFRPLVGGTPSKFNGAGHAAYLTLFGSGHVYLTDYNSTISAIVEGPPSLSVANNQMPPAAGIASCSGAVFWAWGQPSVIATRDSTSTLPKVWYMPSEPAAITGLACDLRNFYWIENNRSIRWTDRVLREPEEPLYTSDTDFGNEADAIVGDIAVDNDWIYFTKPLDRAIYKLAKPLQRDR
jgi:hypothetical protein